MFNRLHPDEIGYVLSFLDDLYDILAVARCNKGLYRDADQRAAFKNVTWFTLRARESYPTSGLLFKHPRLAFEGRVSHIRKLPEEFLSVIKKLTVVKTTLDADGDVLATLLPQAQCLSILIFYDCDFGDDIMATIMGSLSGLSQLHTIDISNNKLAGITSIAALGAHIATNNALTFLDMRSSFPETNGCAEILAQGLAKSRSLTHLDISGNNIGDGGLASIASAISSDIPLHTLNLGWNLLTEKSSGALTELLKKLPLLKTLTAQANRLGDVGIAAIGAALIGSKIQNLSVNYNYITSAASSSLEMLVAGLPDLRTLNININKIEMHGVAAIVVGLRARKTGPLQLLELACTGGREPALMLIRKCIEEGLLKSIIVDSSYCPFDSVSKTADFFDGLPTGSVKILPY
jgi:hypothetical protein